MLFFFFFSVDRLDYVSLWGILWSKLGFLKIKTCHSLMTGKPMDIRAFYVLRLLKTFVNQSRKQKRKKKRVTLTYMASADTTVLLTCNTTT